MHIGLLSSKYKSYLYKTVIDLGGNVIYRKIIGKINSKIGIIKRKIIYYLK